MAESEVYFEPYYNVLKALQRFNSDTFPMKKYFVYVETKTDRPAHTRNGSDVYIISAGENGRKTIQLFNPRTWPSCSELGFDSSQYDAYKAALTNDLVVIQGPPGTGKTYLGLKIAAALLENSEMWNSDHKTPILVICYTNHALDQFLEGIIQKDLSNNIVRIGGRSKSELLEPFNLVERRKSIAYYSANSDQVALRNDLKREMSNVFESIKVLQDNLEHLANNDGILSLKTLQVVMNENQKFFFRNNDDLLKWLLFGVNEKVKSQQGLISTHDKHGVRKESEDLPNDFEFDLSDFENVTRLKEVLFDSIELDNPENAQSSSDSDLHIYFTCTFDEIKKKLEEYSKLLERLPGSEGSRDSIKQKMQEAKQAERDLNLIIQHFDEKLTKTNIPSSEESNKLFEVRDLNNLNVNDRWVLYKSWVEFLKAGYWMLIGKQEERYRYGSLRYQEVRQFDDLRVVQQADVVGITTTTAARLQAMLRELRPKIVIVEEAAEVLEAHIIASLSVYCQHLILIGDHKQLRPSPADYRIGKDYHLDVSLFERLINNGVNFHTLTTQHRMRPEISSLLVPTIYSTLRDHPSTHSRPRVLGMENNLFFMTHTNFEEGVADIMSKRNQFEARLVMMLARHLLLQGYRPDEISVLTTYNGQMYLLKDEQKRLEISPDLLVTVVDNFQGEENRIILLSLVRSNAENKIGFLKTENRVCVALSRARDGLYVFGNMDCLTAESTLWQRIKQSFINQNAYGPALVLRCETHRNQLTRIMTHSDFNSVLEGGCSKPCNEALPCGHICKSLCHVSKDRHTRYRCSESCIRLLCADRHPCPKKCYQPCGKCDIPMVRTLSCGHQATFPCCVDYRSVQCKQLVSVKFPECNHEVKVECYRKDYKQCPEPCPYRLDCGHSCTRMCHITDDPDHLNYICAKPCARRPLACTTETHRCMHACYEECKPCTATVVKQLPCGHSLTTECIETDLRCLVVCNKKMACGHRCTNLCFEECGNCQVKVEKVVPLCGHKVKIACSVVPDKRDCRGQCSVRLRCGHKCAKRCKDTCNQADCKELAPLAVALPCGHTGCVLPCNIVADFTNFANKYDKEELVQHCSEPCLEALKCGHRCSGTCGQCMQGRIHKVCDKDCGNTLICGHSCTVPCREVCPPCGKKCQNRCIHSECSKKCGEPCTPCNEPCEYRCVHSRCTKKCGELCNRKPCTEPCLMTLPCSHACVGFCGEPCPPCKQCSPEDVFDDPFYLADDDSKWVLLNDCKHVLEAEGLEKWLGMDQEGSEIKLKTCPKCRHTEPNRYIATTQRYMNLVKKTFKDIQTVKEKIYGEIREIRNKREELLKDIKRIPDTQMDFPEFQGRDELKTLRKMLLSELRYIKDDRRNEISNHKESLLQFMAFVYLSIQDRVNSSWKKLLDSNKQKIFVKVNFLISMLNQRKEKINKEEITSFSLELNRLHRMFELYLLESSGNFRVLKSLEKIIDLHNKIKKEVFSFKVFQKDTDDKVGTYVKDLSKLLDTTVSDEERVMIHKAMASSFHGGERSTNRWYKCAGCGDVYCVENCGAVNQIAKCGRCRTTIGDHSRVRDTEMANVLGRAIR